MQRGNCSLEDHSSQHRENLDLNLRILTPNICFYLIYICCFGFGTGVKVFLLWLHTRLNIAEHVLHVCRFRVFPVAVTARAAQAPYICFIFRILGLSLTTNHLKQKSLKQKKNIFRQTVKMSNFKSKHSEFFLTISSRILSVSFTKAVCYSKFIQC